MTAWLVAFTPLAFVAPPTRLTPPHSGAKLAVPMQSRVFVPRMGFLDQFKEAFENEPELEKARKQGNKKTASYVQEKIRKREAYDKRVAAQKQDNSKKGEIETGNSRLDEILSGWKW